MGLHFSVVIAKASVAQFREAFLRICPQFELVTSDDNLPNVDAAWEWKNSHEQFVSAADWTNDNPGREVYVFWHDGPWAIMADSTYTLSCDDEEHLPLLSSQLGIVMSFLTQENAGCAYFWRFENGTLRRMIINMDTDVTTKGEPLPEEAGIDISNYYTDETEALWMAFGLSPFEKISTQGPCQAICVIDRTDYSYLRDRVMRRLRNPWWKFW